MTRRTALRQKLVDAAHAARAADSWIGDEARRARLADIIGSARAQAHGPVLLRYARVRRRCPGFETALSDVFKTAPKLGLSLANPAALEHLILMTGAGMAGGGMARLVGRNAVAQLINGLGEDVWAYGVEQGGGVNPDAPKAPARQVNDPDHHIALIQDEGCKAVFAYLEQTADGLGVAAFAAANIPSASGVVPQDLSNAMSAVQGALERVSS